MNTTKTGKVIKKDNYTITIEFQGLKDLIKDREEWVNLSKKDKRDLMKKIVDSMDVKLHSTDPSFLRQGTWNLLEELGVALYKFPKGVPRQGRIRPKMWEKIHGTPVHLGKHFLNTFNTLKGNIDKMINIISREYHYHG
jgi:hypothetical protein